MQEHDLLIQAIGFIGTLLYFLSFQFSKNKNLFRVQIFSYVFYSTHMLLLGAVTGSVSYMLNCVRSICLSGKWEFGKSKSMCVILCALQLAALVLTWGGWISFLPVIANIASTVGGYTKNPKKVRIAGIFVNSPLCIVYDIIVGSWAGIADELIGETSMIISVIRYGWNKLDKTEE